MATVEVYEHTALRGGLSVLTFPLITKQSLTTGSSATHLSAAFNPGTTYITAISTSPFRFSIASSGSLSTSANHVYWPAEVPLNASVMPGHKFLALSSTTT